MHGCNCKWSIPISYQDCCPSKPPFRDFPWHVQLPEGILEYHIFQTSIYSPSLGDAAATNRSEISCEGFSPKNCSQIQLFSSCTYTSSTSFAWSLWSMSVLILVLFLSPLLVGYFCPFGKFEVAVATTSLENEGNCQGKPRDIFGHIWSPKFGISRSVYIDMNRYFMVKDWFTLAFLVLYHHLVYHCP